MTIEVKDAPVVEKKDTKVEDKTTETKDVKVGEALKTKEEPKDIKMVPEAVLLDFKKENKDLHKELKDLKKLIEDGATKKEVSADIKSLAEKHNVDPEFLTDFAAAVRKEAEGDADAKLKPIRDKEQADKLETVFNTNFDKTLEEMPEYSKLVNKDVIRTLAFDPKNANKTFAQIFESAYGHLVTGKKTLEPTKPQGGKADTTVDVARAQRDPAYFNEIMADPDLKKQYNSSLESRIPV